MNCPWCGYRNLASANFCGGCGRSLTLDVVCPACDSKNPSEHRLCDACGTPLAHPHGLEADLGGRRKLTLRVAFVGRQWETFSAHVAPLMHRRRWSPPSSPPPVAYPKSGWWPAPPPSPGERCPPPPDSCTLAGSPFLQVRTRAGPGGCWPQVCWLQPSASLAWDPRTRRRVRPNWLCSPWPWG